MDFKAKTKYTRRKENEKKNYVGSLMFELEPWFYPACCSGIKHRYSWRTAGTRMCELR